MKALLYKMSLFLSFTLKEVSIHNKQFTEDFSLSKKVILPNNQFEITF